MNKYMKGSAILIILLLTANMILFGLGKISVLFFWINIGIGFVALQIIKRMWKT